MSEPFVGEIRMFGGNFAPRGWAFCDGAVLPISQNDVLFSLIGTTYGGDGQTTFNLPDLRGRLPVHQGSGFVIGQSAGTRNGHPDGEPDPPAYSRGVGAYFGHCRKPVRRDVRRQYHGRQSIRRPPARR